MSELNKDKNALVKKDFFGSLKSEFDSERRKQDIAKLLPKYLTPERFFMVAYDCIVRTPGLQRCSKESLVKAVMEAAEAGLEIGGALQHAYLIPYGNEAKFMPGWRGLVHLAVMAGGATKIDPELVYAKDYFKYERGTHEKLVHRPNVFASDRGDVLGAYAVAKLPDGSLQFEVMSKAEVEKVRKSSKAANNGPWVDWWGEMAKKTPVRRLCKRLKLSGPSDEVRRFAKAIEADNEAAGLEERSFETTATVIDSRLEEPSKVLDEIEAAKSEPAQPPREPEPADIEDAELPSDPINEVKLKTLEDAAQKQGLDEFEIGKVCSRYGADDFKSLKNDAFSPVLLAIINWNKKARRAEQHA